MTRLSGVMASVAETRIPLSGAVAAGGTKGTPSLVNCTSAELPGATIRSIGATVARCTTAEVASSGGTNGKPSFVNCTLAAAAGSTAIQLFGAPAKPAIGSDPAPAPADDPLTARTNGMPVLVNST